MWLVFLGRLQITIAYTFFDKFLIGASGNNNSTEVIYPANSPFVFSVGATSESGRRAQNPDLYWANGFGSNFGTYLDVVAPGTNIWSTINGNGYDTGSGTSYASPQVAGIAALLKSYNNSLTNANIKEIISRSTVKARQDIYSYNQNKTYGTWNNEMGYGRVNAYNALLSIVPPDPPNNLLINNPNSIGANPILSWGPSQRANYYKIYRRNAWDLNWGYLGTTSLTTFTDIFLDITNPNSPGAENFYYQVRAFHDYGISIPSNSVSIWGLSFFKKRDEKAVINSVPIYYSLESNYPNPFNPTTTIKYELPEASSVSISIYDIRGNEVKTWENANESPGYKQITWQATDSHGNKVPAGIYIYKLTATSHETDKVFSKSMKMVLLK